MSNLQLVKDLSKKSMELENSHNLLKKKHEKAL